MMGKPAIWLEPERAARLQALLADGKSFSQIATAFGDCSRVSVAGAVRRAGLRANVKPQARLYASERERRLAADKRRRERLKAAGIKRVYKPRPSAAKPAPPPAVRAPGELVPFQSYRYTLQCAWIMAEGDRYSAEAIAVCGHSTGGEVYCGFHAGRAVSVYQRPTGRINAIGVGMRSRA